MAAPIFYLMTERADQKQLLRVQALKHRSMSDLRAEDPIDAAALFFEHIKPADHHVIAGYYPKGREFDALHILETWVEQGGKACLPKIIDKRKILEFYEWTPDTEMVKGRFDILEPDGGDPLEPDIILVPLLAFDRKGGRLGYGGGYYDATLADLRARKNIVAVGAGFSAQAVLFTLPIEEHDQPLDWILTPQTATSF